MDRSLTYQQENQNIMDRVENFGLAKGLPTTTSNKLLLKLGTAAVYDLHAMSLTYSIKQALS